MAETTTAPEPEVRMDEALRTLGVRDDLLSEEERTALDEDGVVILEGYIPAGMLESLRQKYDELVDDNWILNLVGKGDVFHEVINDPKLLTAAAHVIGRPFKLLAINGRSAPPGAGAQKLHPDFPSAVKPGDYSVLNSMWMLDDFTEDNGATRYVPASHRSGRVPGDEMEDVHAVHPKERKLVAPAGSVAIINAHVWHGGTLNTTQRPRRVVACAFTSREFPQQADQRAALGTDGIARLTPAERWLLDV